MDCWCFYLFFCKKNGCIFCSCFMQLFAIKITVPQLIPVENLNMCIHKLALSHLMYIMQLTTCLQLRNDVVGIAFWFTQSFFLYTLSNVWRRLTIVSIALYSLCMCSDFCKCNHLWKAIIYLLMLRTNFRYCFFFRDYTKSNTRTLHIDMSAVTRNRTVMTKYKLAPR